MHDTQPLGNALVPSHPAGSSAVEAEEKPLRRQMTDAFSRLILGTQPFTGKKGSKGAKPRKREEREWKGSAGCPRMRSALLSRDPKETLHL